MNTHTACLVNVAGEEKGHILAIGDKILFVLHHAKKGREYNQCIEMGEHHKLTPRCVHSFLASCSTALDCASYTLHSVWRRDSREAAKRHEGSGSGVVD